ncbi:hypothetical protein CRT60_01090 [Azospirillum palustre]|uniref:Transcriptional regulator n=1 Tax=Azospirillum palustre TaxID=2044885 RepID=A0A2B8BPV1_9PROT|nr:hypothetical protein [Azospirillum palustre]PGH59257.1 hypothetical protein CRT60_01090 [Azospirillum palustre]
MGRELLHYTGCGLDHIYLRGGFEAEQMAGETYVSVQGFEGLYQAIAEAIISSPAPMRGQEVRFLRGRLRLSQEDFAKSISRGRSAVAAWEADRDTVIDGIADGAIRWLCWRRMSDEAVAVALVARMREQDARDDAGTRGDGLPALRRVFEANGDGWRLAPNEHAG